MFTPGVRAEEGRFADKTSSFRAQGDSFIGVIMLLFVALLGAGELNQDWMKRWADRGVPERGVLLALPFKRSLKTFQWIQGRPGKLSWTGVRKSKNLAKNCF